MDGEVWVAEADADIISLFNPDGTVAGSPLTGNGLSFPHQLAAIDGQVWVTNENGNSLSIFTPPSGAPSPGGLARVRTVFLIIMENHDWSEIAGNPAAPSINDTLLPMASYAGAYYDPSGYHSSLTDYLWLENGQCFQYCGSDNDPSPSPDGIAPGSSPNALHALLANAGISWREYAQGITNGSCPLSDTYPYAVRHNPFVYFNDVNGSPSCLVNVRSAADLPGDLSSGSVARYNVITPDLCHDMHDACAPTWSRVAQGGAWLSTVVPEILQSSAYQNGGALFITWDEGDGDDGPLGMIVLSPYARGRGYANDIYYTHSSFLRTMQEVFRVGPLLGDAHNATDLSDMFTPN